LKAFPDGSLHCKHSTNSRFDTLAFRFYDSLSNSLIRIIQDFFNIYYKHQMHSELPPARNSEQAREIRLGLDRRLIRKAIKDVREHIQSSSPRLPHREQLLKLVDEILVLAPPLSEEDEQIDERRRKMDAGRIDPFGEEE
jgi:hypothetical protein